MSMVSKETITGRAAKGLTVSCIAAFTASALGQGVPETLRELTVVDVEAVGDAPTGPYSVVVEHDPDHATRAGGDEHTLSGVLSQGRQVLVGHDDVGHAKVSRQELHVG